MQCDYLLEFATTVDCGSIAKAADELGLSQSSLSRHIKTLETELGMQLLRRSPSGVEATHDGTEIYSRAYAILDVVDDIEAYVASRHNAKPLAVYGLYDYPGLYRRLYDGCQKLGFQNGLRTLSPDSLEASSPKEALESGDIAIWVTYSTDELLPQDEAPSLRSCEIFHPRMTAVMEPTNPLAAKRSLVAEDFEGCDFIKSESSYLRAGTSWAASKALLGERGIHYRTKTGTFEHESDLLADYGSRIMLMPEGNRLINLHLSFGKVAVPVEDLVYTFMAVCRADDRTARRLIEECKDKEKDGERTESLSTKS